MMRLKNKIIYYSFLLIALIMIGGCDSTPPRENKVLVFSKTSGYRHQSIEAGIEAIKSLGSSKGFGVTATENANDFSEENLEQYNAVIFLNTTMDVLNVSQQAVFERYIQSGKGFVGIHAAADTEYHWKWYNNLVGAYFNGHPNNPNVREAKITVLDKNHLSTKMLSDTWIREDEWYNYKSINPDINVLMNLDETSYEGGTNGENHPIAWYHDYDGGRAFYTGLGHTEESFKDPMFLDHLNGGIQYAIGKNEAPDYSKATTQLVPEENRFTKVVLASNLNEPTEMTVLDNGKIIFVERRGNVKMYFPEEDTVKVIGTIDVHTQYEDGLMGVALDPNHNENNWIYLYYSPAGDKPIQHLSRFELVNDQLNMGSEIVMLEVPVQRLQCCHTGGSIEFGPDGNLFLSTGDDTNPFNSNGYGPIDERPNRGPWDAQRSSGNTNDLRGKILRITPQPDGTYTIPDGNLFPKDDPKSRPEIYVMGCRNPYRISIDQKTGYLYWGDVGPDAGENSEDRGPRGHDEINQARKAGFFGWPYFVGDNKAYKDFDFASNTSGDLFDASRPINASANNTGRNELPPAQPAFIFYPYADSPEFPIVGKGGRNAMAGPIFYKSEFTSAKNKFPDYFDEKLFIYDWIRNWIMIVKMDENGDFHDIHPFMPNTGFSNVMDMEFGKDGSLYAVEYGQKWFNQNEDARLFRIDYNGGNRPPTVDLLADKKVGASPLTVNFTANAIDYDNDELRYSWSFGENLSVDETNKTTSFTYQQPGVYHPEITVVDEAGNESSSTLEVVVGNEPPVVEIQLEGNQTFYQDNRSLNYKVVVNDLEDGNSDDGTIGAEEIYVTVDYLEQGYDKTLIEQGHKSESGFTKFMAGKRLIDASDCKSCHQKNEKSIGPSYFQIANKYNENDKAYLAEKVIKGGGGVWGEQAMAAHPQFTQEESEKMIDYILSINDEKAIKGLPIQNSYVLREHLSAKVKQGTYFLKASYTDKGSDKVGAISGDKTIVLRSPEILGKDYDSNEGTITFEIPDTDIEVEVFNDESYIAFENIDLTDVKSITLMVGKNEQLKGGTVELRIGGIDGEIIASGDATQNAPMFPVELGFSSPIDQTADIYLVAKNKEAAGTPLFGLVNLKFNF